MGKGGKAFTQTPGAWVPRRIKLPVIMLSMAVKTRVSPAHFKQLLAHYELGGYLDAQPIPAGSVQTNYHLFTGAGHFIFRCYENRSREAVLFETHLLSYLKSRRYPCPAPIPDQSGEAVGVIGGKPFVIFEFLEGSGVENASEAQRMELVRMAAELHNLTAGFRPVHLEYRWNYDVDLCRSLVREAAERENTSGGWEKLAWYEEELQRLVLPESLPKGICHCDFHFSNVLYANGKFSALIDFDDANYTYLLYDLATLIEPFRQEFTWETWERFSPEEEVFDFREGRKAAAEYQKVRALSRVEKSSLFDVYKLSILMDGIWYFNRGLTGDFYEKRKIDCLNRLGRERFASRMFAA